MQTFKKTSSVATVRAEEKAFIKTRMTVRTTAVLIALCFCAFTHKAVAWTGSGTSGSPWQISDGSTAGNSVTAYRNGSTLYINGTGNMADFLNSTEGEAPWYSVRTNIQTVVIQNGVTNIGNNAFHDCSNLQSITIPSSVFIIGVRAFHNCTSSNFAAITIPTTVNKIEAEAFWNCTSLKTVTIENGVNDLAFIDYYDTSSFPFKNHEDWFKNCPIQTLHLGRNYTVKNTTYPFEGTATLQTLTIGNTVTSIGREAFANCYLLKTVTFQDGTSILTIHTYPYDSQSFANSPLETVYIGRPLSYLTSAASPFQKKTTLKTVTINSNVTVVPNYSFSDCTALQSITNNATTPQTINSNVFTGVNKQNCVLKVPAASLSQYKAKDVWKEFFIQGVAGSCNNVGDVLSGNASLGSAVVLKYVSNDVAEIAALPKAGNVFVSWNDGNTQNPRTVSLCNTNFTAQFASCSSSGVADVRSASAVQIYPNPTQDELFIKSELAIEQVEIVDLAGRIVETRLIASLRNGTAAINVSALPAGVYLLKIQTNAGALIKKFVKE